MRLAFVTMMGATAALAAPAGAQPQQVEADKYLCATAGKCGGDAPVEATKAAPETKGFHLAQATQTPTKDAPATKGFHLAQANQSVAAPATKGFHLAQAAPTATETAPATRGFHIAHATTVPATRTSRTMVAQRRGYVGATRTAPPAGAIAGAGTRANLLLAFDTNSAQLTPAAEAKARSFAQALNMDALKDRRFLIEGHTDAKGSRDANIDLSRRRAQSVADFLIAQGVDRGRVEVRGVGPDQPLPGRPASAESNRRVEAVLLS